MVKPLILITNDDGILAPGIRALVEAVLPFATPVVVAPDSPQSGQGHAITIHAPIRLHPVDAYDGIEAYECSGTPVDCVKLAKHVVLNGRVPALCLSGINHGSNAAINIIYSGTMSAAMEASLEGIPSIGFSMLDYSFKADFSASKILIGRLVQHILVHGMHGAKLLNVNIPKGAIEDIKGFKVCRQADARWVESFTDATDPRGQKYYWLKGEFVNGDPGEDTDVWALENGYASIVPSMHDLTHYPAIEANRLLETL
ncbi:MAG: 5'/3'-nucleotidase SurE [Saprospiraceae bacterium]